MRVDGRSPEVTELVRGLDAVRRRNPRTDCPRILMCGGTGVGKTTTVNAILGWEAGKVGHFARGTESPQGFVGEVEGRRFELMDLPGLGDSKERDRGYKLMYTRAVRFATSAVVVVTPPRPAAIPTIRSVKQLVKAGFPVRRIVFAFNRLTMLNFAADGIQCPVRIDGQGPVDADGRAAVALASQTFVRELALRAGTPQLTVRQVVPYDALRGWNTYQVLVAALGLT